MTPQDLPLKRYPTVALPIFHQAPGPATGAEFEGMLKEFRSRLLAEAANLSVSRAKNV